MKNNILGVVSAVALMLTFSGCGSSGGGDGGTSNPGPGGINSISGSAMAPGGMVAALELEQRSVVAVAWDFVMPVASAAISGLMPVPEDTMVELIRVDNNGDQIGGVLATALVSITGNYTLPLPEGVDLSGDLVVRITGGGGAELSAQVVAATVDISPLSEFLLQKYIENGSVLADLATNEVVALSGRLAGFDINGTGNNLDQVLAQLEEDAGDLADTDIVMNANGPGDAGTVTGNWTISTFSYGLFDSADSALGTYGLDLEAYDFVFSSAGNEQINVAETELGSAFTNYDTFVDGNGAITYSLFHESGVGGDTDSFTASIDANGTLYVQNSFEEEFQDQNPSEQPFDGPEFAFRYPPRTSVLYDSGNGNLKFIVDRELSARYDTLDSNSDGVKDAADLDSLSGLESFTLLSFLVREGSDLGNDDLMGDYGIIGLGNLVNINVEGNGGAKEIESFQQAINADGAGTLTRVDDEDSIFISRSLNGGVNSAQFGIETDTDDEEFSIPYTVSADGGLTLQDGDDETGQISDDGRFFFLTDVGTETEGGQVVESEYVLTMGVRLGSTAPSLGGASYQMIPFILGQDTQGQTDAQTFSADSDLVFAQTPTSATLNSTNEGFRRATDVAQIERIDDDSENIPLEVSTQNNGAISMTMGDSLALEGFVSDDASIMILRVYSTDSTGEIQTGQSLGVIIGIRQSAGG